MAKFNPFNIIRTESVDTNNFDLSFDNKLSLDMGKLYPVLTQETLPGDYFKIEPQMLIRMHPMLFPIMHRIDATLHFFYVPNRILWKNWKKFIAGENFVPPYYEGEDGMGGAWQILPGSLEDYMGLPITANLKEKVLAFPFLAYQKIYNEYYQDQNNDTLYPVMRDSLEAIFESNGKLTTPDGLPVLPRAWEHDYFTSALPFAQRSNPVNIPVSLTDLEVRTWAVEDGPGNPAPDGTLESDLGALTIGTTNVQLSGIAYASDASLNGKINDLRSAIALQKFLELQARTGVCYNELIRAHFPGVDIGDARINRPEYIGGIKNNVVISEVLQTSKTDESSALGEYAGHGTTYVNGNPISFYAPEHGWIMGILSVMPRTAYFQGLNRKFTRLQYLDYYWSHFAHIGEQAILNKELYYSDTDGLNNDTFGYIPRYSEYKYNPSQVHGDMRGSLVDFHLARYFTNRPNLNEEFIYCSPDQTDRIFAVQEPGTDSLYAHIYFDIQAKRKIPFFTNPGGL